MLFYTLNVCVSLRNLPALSYAKSKMSLIRKLRRRSLLVWMRTASTYCWRIPRSFLRKRLSDVIFSLFRSSSIFSLRRRYCKFWHRIEFVGLRISCDTVALMSCNSFFSPWATLYMISEEMSIIWRRLWRLEPES